MKPSNQWQQSQRPSQQRLPDQEASQSGQQSQGLSQQRPQSQGSPNQWPSHQEASRPWPPSQRPTQPWPQNQGSSQSWLPNQVLAQQLSFSQKRTLGKWSRTWHQNRFVRYNLITVAVLLIVGFVWVYPFLWALSGAFKTQIGLFTSGANLIPNQFDFSNFQRAWITAGFSQYFFNTLLYSSASTLIELLKSALCGYILARYRFPGRNLLYALIVGTLFIPLASIILPQFLVVESLGLLNTQAGVILAFSGASGALYVLLFANFFKGVPEELFDAAKVDGASFVRLFRLVFPLARPVIATVVIFNFIATWNDFNIPLIYTLSAPDLRNLAVGMFAFQGENSFDWTGFAAGTVISFVPVLIVFLLFQGYFVRGLSGAVKE